MKFIEKGSEVPEFTRWKAQANENWQPDWDNLAGEPKLNIHRALLMEQGYICCYCNQRIDETNSHIEHLMPRKLYKNRELEYNNILASCQKNLKRKEPRHCGVLKDNWYDPMLMVSPLDKDCENRFRFIEDGCILPVSESDDSAKTTITKLGLDIDKLKALRRKAIEGVTDILDSLSLKEIQSWITALHQRDSDRSFTPFCQILIQILKTYI